MKLTILGNNGPFPAEGGACSGYLLRSGSGRTNILIDCGTGSLANLSRHIEFPALDAVILSHLHFDHMSDILPMQYALQFKRKENPLAVYTARTPEAVRRLLDVPCYKLQDMQDVQIGEIRFSFLPVRHPVESYAVRAECDGKIFVYSGDTNTMPGLEDFFRNADLLLADAGLSRAAWNENAPHLSAEHCGMYAKDAHVGRLLLSHLNPCFDPETLLSEAKEHFAAAELARIGESYDI